MKNILNRFVRAPAPAAVVTVESEVEPEPSPGLQSDKQAEWDAAIKDLKASSSTVDENKITLRPPDKFATIYLLTQFEIYPEIMTFELNGISTTDDNGKEVFSQNNDMIMIRYIRMLYCMDNADWTAAREVSENTLTREKYSVLQNDIKTHLAMYPFWPPLEKFKDKDIRKIEFWSENHLLMHLSCAYLYYQFLAIENKDDTLQFETENKECQYLKIWFELHFHPLMSAVPGQPGIYEVFSHVYLCFTLCALMNIYDYCRNPDLKAKAEVMIDRIVSLLVLGLEPKSGISTFTGEDF
jgi:hypothetical protein